MNQASASATGLAENLVSKVLFCTNQLCNFICNDAYHIDRGRKRHSNPVGFVLPEATVCRHATAQLICLILSNLLIFELSMGVSTIGTFLE